MSMVESGLTRRNLLAAAGAVALGLGPKESNQPQHSPFIELPLQRPAEAITNAEAFYLLSQPIHRIPSEQLTAYLQGQISPGMIDVSNGWQPVLDSLGVHTSDRQTIPVKPNRGHASIAYDGTIPVHASFIDTGDQRFIQLSRPGTLKTRKTFEPMPPSGRLLLTTSH